jgi:hypothetical protein
MEGDISVTPFIPTEPDALSPETQDGLSLSTQRSDSPLRKRARRRSSNSSTMDASQLLTVSPQPDVPQRDPKYYMADGSCVLRVANTLFNVWSVQNRMTQRPKPFLLQVHRSILSADSSSFGTLFTLPQGDITVEGTSDDNPIVLQGDTPEEFRNFLWSLYAL